MLKPIVCFCAVLMFSLSARAGGFVHASGKKVMDVNGQELILRGHAPGGWMIQEPYMMEISANSQHEIREKIQSLLGEENTAAFYRKWLANGPHLWGIQPRSARKGSLDTRWASSVHR